MVEVYTVYMIHWLIWIFSAHMLKDYPFSTVMTGHVPNYVLESMGLHVCCHSKCTVFLFLDKNICCGY